MINSTSLNEVHYNTHNMCPMTKHLNLVFHHFRSFVKNGLIEIWPIGTEYHRADILTNPTSRDVFVKHRKALNGF
jgi:hypothetical protein